jgi:hypothetical protein
MHVSKCKNNKIKNRGEEDGERKSNRGGYLNLTKVQYMPILNTTVKPLSTLNVQYYKMIKKQTLW